MVFSSKKNSSIIGQDLYREEEENSGVFELKRSVLGSPHLLPEASGGYQHNCHPNCIRIVSTGHN